MKYALSNARFWNFNSTVIIKMSFELQQKLHFGDIWICRTNFHRILEMFILHTTFSIFLARVLYCSDIEFYNAIKIFMDNRKSNNNWTELLIPAIPENKQRLYYIFGYCTHIYFTIIKRWRLYGIVCRMTII